jgi:hypothetical protein
MPSRANSIPLVSVMACQVVSRQPPSSGGGAPRNSGADGGERGSVYPPLGVALAVLLCAAGGATADAAPWLSDSPAPQLVRGSAAARADTQRGGAPLGLLAEANPAVLRGLERLRVRMRAWQAGGRTDGWTDGRTVACSPSCWGTVQQVWIGSQMEERMAAP